MSYVGCLDWCQKDRIKTAHHSFGWLGNLSKLVWVLLPAQTYFLECKHWIDWNQLEFSRLVECWILNRINNPLAFSEKIYFRYTQWDLCKCISHRKLACCWHSLGIGSKRSLVCSRWSDLTKFEPGRHDFVDLETLESMEFKNLGNLWIH